MVATVSYIISRSIIPGHATCALSGRHEEFVDVIETYARQSCDRPVGFKALSLCTAMTYE